MEVSNQSRFSAKKTFKICHTCKGKGYCENSQANKSFYASSGTCITSQPDVAGHEELNEDNKYSNHSSFSLTTMTTQGSSIELPIKKIDRSVPISLNKLKMSVKSDFNKSTSPTSAKRIANGIRKLKSLGSDASVNSDMSDLIKFDRGIENTRDVLKQAKNKIKSSNWDVIMSGLEDMAILCAQYPDQRSSCQNSNGSLSECNFNNGIVDWDTIGQAMTKLVGSFHLKKNRSVRLSCQILREFFRTMTHSVHRPQFDDAVNELMKRTADTSRMIRWDAHQALETMITYVPVQFSTRAIINLAPRHKNPLVRRTAMRLLNTVVTSVTSSVLMNQPQMREPRKQIINTLCLLIDDPNQHVRWLVRKTVQALMSEECFDDVINLDVEPQIYKKADRSLVLVQYNTETG